MKRLLILTLLLVSVNAFSQNFEGTLKWAIKTDFTDPKRKAEMEEAQKKMSDPANQAKMKELEAKMQDPQFKAMMESNPQMKVQLEKLISAAKSGNFNSIMPTGMTIKIKNTNTVSKVEGGAFSMEVLYVKDQDKAYSLDRENKTYSVLPKMEKKEGPGQADNAIVTKTSETGKVLNYNCTKYIVETQNNGRVIKQNIWATTEIKDFDLKGLARQQMGKGQRLFYEEIDGVPLKVEMNIEGMLINMEVAEIKKESLPAADFAVPTGFREVPLMFK